MATRVDASPTVVTRAAATRSEPDAAGSPQHGRVAALAALRSHATAAGDALTRPWTPVRVAWWAGGAIVGGGSVGAVGGLLTLLSAG